VRETRSASARAWRRPRRPCTQAPCVGAWVRACARVCARAHAFVGGCARARARARRVCVHARLAQLVQHVRHLVVAQAHRLELLVVGRAQLPDVLHARALLEGRPVGGEALVPPPELAHEGHLPLEAHRPAAPAVVVVDREPP